MLKLKLNIGCMHLVLNRQGSDGALWMNVS